MDKTPPRLADVLRLAAIDSARALPEAALSRLDAYAEFAPLPKAAALLRTQALNRLGRLEEALSEARLLREQYPDASNCARLLAQLLYLSGLAVEFDATFAESLERWPSEPNLLMSLNQLSIGDSAFGRFYGMVRQAHERESFSPRAQYEYAIAALRVGEIEEAAEALDSIAHRSSVAGRMRRGLSYLSADEWRGRFRVGNDPTQVVQQARKPGAQAVVVVLPGARNRFDQLHPSYLDALLHEFEVNAIYLADTSLRSCVEGVPALGSSLEQTAASLKAMAEEMGARRIYTMGSSMGGFTAVRYGELMGAASVLTVSGYTKLNTPGDTSDDAERTFIRTTGDEFLGDRRSIRPSLETASEMHLLQLVAADNPHDVRQARRVEDLPQVRTLLVPGVTDHAAVVHDMIATGEFRQVLKDWLV